MPQDSPDHIATGLPRSWITSAEVFDRETEKIFGRHWICVGRTDLLNPLSGVCPVQFEDHRLMLVADENKQIRAFRNFCRHRGCRLVTEENCARIGQRLQCPYHAWTYDRHGRLVSAPNMETIDGFQPTDYGLIEVPCQTLAGFVWINFQPDQPLERFLAPLESQFVDWSLEELGIAAEMSYTVNANWKLIFQNFNECYHCPIVHPVLNRLTPYRDTENELVSGPLLGGPMKLSDGIDTMSTDGQLVGQLLPGLNGIQARSVNYYTIFPNLFFSPHPDYVLTHRIQRVSVSQTRVDCQLLFAPKAMAESSFDPQRAAEFWDMTNQQDWEVCELSQAGIEDAGYVPGPYSGLEKIVVAFDEHYRAVMGND